MPRLPRANGKDVVKALVRGGFEVFDQEGSHVYLHKRINDKFSPRITVPLHTGKTLKPKTLQTILKSAGLTVEDFIAL